MNFDINSKRLSENKYYRQECVDGVYEDAILQGCNIIQPKYDGIWCACRIEILDDEHIVCDYFSRNNKIKLSSVIQADLAKHKNTLPIKAPFTLVGELMYGTERSKKHPQNQMFVFDIWDERHESYIERLTLVQTILLLLPRPRFEVTLNWATTSFETIWERLVKTEILEGVVYRKSTNQQYDDSLIRQKLVVTMDFVCTGFVEGEGKYKGTLGALKLTSMDDPRVETTAAGMTDAERDEIWQNQTRFIGRVCELKGFGKFESGQLRHPQFVSWKPDV